MGDRHHIHKIGGTVSGFNTIALTTTTLFKHDHTKML